LILIKIFTEKTLIIEYNVIKNIKIYLTINLMIGRFSMNARDIKIGTKLEVEIPENDSNTIENTTSYISQMVDVVDDNTISIASPMREGKLKFLSKGTNIIIYYLNEKHELLYFKGVVSGQRKSGALDIFDITIASEFNKIQRRRFYRLDVVLSCTYAVIDEQLISTDNLEFPDIDNAQLSSAFTKNISGSGFCIVIDKSIAPGAVLYVTIDLEGLASVRVLAQVIRSSYEKSKKYEVGLHYLKISPKDSDILTRYIFEKQRQMLKNTMQAKLRYL